MNELFDKLILRIVVAAFLCTILFLYKYAHILFYPPAKSQLFKKFYPSRNPADTIHFFFKDYWYWNHFFLVLYFNINDGLLYGLLGFFLQTIVTSTLFLLSIYILESITLYNFEYKDEIITRKNLSYGIISFSHAISIALLIKAITQNSNNSFATLLFLWPLALVLFGLLTKLYPFLSQFSFNKLIIHKNLALAFSYSGFLIGISIITISSLNHELINIVNFSYHVILKILLSVIIFPIFQKGIIKVFNIQIESKENQISSEDKKDEFLGPPLGLGVFEGSIFFTSCFLTSIITGHILFGNFYPNLY